MKFIILSAVGATFLGFFIIMTNGHRHSICKCPKIQIQANLSDPAIFAEHQLNIVEKLWNQTSITLTHRSNKLKDEILKMARCDNAQSRNMSFLITIYGWSAAPHIGLKPDLCAYAQMINQTIDWEKRHNCTAQFEVIDKLTSSVQELANMVAATAIKSAGCGCPKIESKKLGCYADGTVYKAKELWALRGWKYPCELKTAALRLYSSKNPIDQLFAAMATASLSDFMGGFVDNFPGETILQILTKQLTPKIPQCCCKNFIKETNSIRDRVHTSCQNAKDCTKKLYPECF